MGGQQTAWVCLLGVTLLVAVLVRETHARQRSHDNEIADFLAASWKVLDVEQAAEEFKASAVHPKDEESLVGSRPLQPSQEEAQDFPNQEEFRTHPLPQSSFPLWATGHCDRASMNSLQNDYPRQTSRQLDSPAKPLLQLAFSAGHRDLTDSYSLTRGSQLRVSRSTSSSSSVSTSSFEVMNESLGSFRAITGDENHSMEERQENSTADNVDGDRRPVYSNGKNVSDDYNARMVPYANTTSDAIAGDTNGIAAPNDTTHNENTKLNDTESDTSAEVAVHIIPSVSCSSQVGVQFILLAKAKQIVIPNSCIAMICFGEMPISRKTGWRSYFWFRSVIKKFNTQCYNALSDNFEGNLLAKPIVFADQIVLLVMPPDCIKSFCQELHVVLAVSNTSIPYPCSALVADPYVAFIPMKNSLIFYIGHRELVKYEKECHDAIGDLVETKKYLSSVVVVSSGKHSSSSENVEYHNSSNFPFQDPCSFASFTTTFIKISVFARARMCPPVDYMGPDLFQTLFLYMRRPISNSSFYTCLNPKEGFREKKSEYQLSLTLKYMLCAAWELGKLAASMKDLVCLEDVRMLSFSGVKNGQAQIYIYTYPITNISTWSPESTKVLETLNLNGSYTSDFVTILSPDLNITVNVATGRTAWCPAGNGVTNVGRGVGVSLAFLLFYNSSVSDACRNIICNSKATKILGGNLRHIYGYHHPLTPVDKVCFKLAKEFGGLVFSGNEIDAFATSNLHGFPIMAVWRSDAMLSTTLIYMSINLLLSGRMDYLKCMHESLNDEVAFTLSQHYTVPVEETKWNKCMKEVRNESSAPEGMHVDEEGANEMSEWYEAFSFNYTPWILIVSKKLKGSIDLSFLSHFIASKLISSVASLEFVMRTERTRIYYSSSMIFILKLPYKDIEKYLSGITNESVSNCYFASYATLCQDKQKPLHYTMIIHECDINFEDEAKLQVLYQSILVSKSLDHILCSETTVVLSSNPVERKVLQVQPKRVSSNVSQSTAELRNVTKGWTLELNSYVLSNMESGEMCFPLPDSFRLDLAFKIGRCVIIRTDGVLFRVRKKFSSSKFFLIMTERTKDAHNTNQSDVLSLLNVKNLVNASVANSGFRKTESMPVGHAYPIMGVHPFERVRVLQVYMDDILKYLAHYYRKSIEVLISDPFYAPSCKTMLQIASNAISSENTECLSDIVRGKTLVAEQVNITYLSGAFDELTVGSCYPDFPKNLLEKCDKAFLEKRGTINKFWPFCGTFNTIVLGTHSSEWHYLTSGCRASQIILLIVSVIITTVTIGGNAFVIVIMHKFRMFNVGEYRRSYILLRSLAFADLLTGLFPGTLWVHDQLSLISGGMTLYELEAKGLYGNFRNLSLKQAYGFQELRFARYGYPMFCSLVMSISSIVSLLTLLFLGIERYKSISTKPLHIVVVGLLVPSSWFVATILALLLFIREDGFVSAGYFDPVTKLTLSIGSSTASISLVVFYLEVVFVSVAGFFMVLLTIYSVHLFMRLRRERIAAKVVAKDEKKLLKDDIERSLLLMVLMLVYLLSAIPVTVNVLAGLWKDCPEFHLLSWWLFMAGSSWNWYFYTFQRKSFREKIQVLLSRRRRRKELKANKFQAKQLESLTGDKDRVKGKVSLPADKRGRAVDNTETIAITPF